MMRIFSLSFSYSYWEEGEEDWIEEDWDAWEDWEEEEDF